MSLSRSLLGNHSDLGLTPALVEGMGLAVTGEDADHTTGLPGIGSRLEQQSLAVLGGLNQ